MTRKIAFGLALGEHADGMLAACGYDPAHGR